MEYWLVNIIGFGIGSGLLLQLNRVVRDPWNYANVFSFFFAVSLAGSQICFGFVFVSEFSIAQETLIIFFLSWWAFLFGSMLMLAGLTPVSQVIKLICIEKNRSINVLIFLIFANFIYNIVSLNVNGTFDALLHSDLNFVNALALNRVLNSGDMSKGHVGWYFELWHIAYIYYVPLSLYMYRMGYISKKLVFIVSMCGLMSSLILFSRIQFLMLLVVIFVTWTILFRPRVKVILSKLATVLFFSFALFIVMQSAIVKNEIIKSDNTLTERIVTYAFSPIISYQELLNGRYREPNPHEALYTLQAIYYFAGKLGLVDAAEYPIGYREYVSAPYMTNVYTFLDAFTLDFGPVGAVVGSFITGMFVAVIYRRLRVLVGFFTLLIYALSVYGCGVAMLANVFISYVFFIQIATALTIHMLLLTVRNTKVTSSNVLEKTNNVFV